MDVTEMPELAKQEAAYLLNRAAVALLGGGSDVEEAILCAEGALMTLKTLEAKRPGNG